MYIHRKHDLSWAREISPFINKFVNIFGVTNLGTWKISWDTRETAFGETDFSAVAGGLAVQGAQTAKPGVDFGVFAQKKSTFFVSRF